MDLRDSKNTKRLKAKLRRYGYSTSTTGSIFGQYLASPIKDTHIHHKRGNPSTKVAHTISIDFTNDHGKKDQMGICIGTERNDNCNSNLAWHNPDWNTSDVICTYIKMPFEEFETIYLLAKEANDRYLEFRNLEKELTNHA